MRKSKYLFIFLVLIVIAFYVNIIVSSVSPNLPRPGQRPILYSNQMRQDLKMTCFKAIKKAKNTIQLVMFGLTDPNIIAILNKKSEENIKLKIFCDDSCPNYLDIKPNQLYRIKGRGLMHQKILIIDDSLVFLGSANFTTSSLVMHDNLIVGFFSPQVAKFLSDKAPLSPGNMTTMIGGQLVDVWLLPDLQNKALFKMVELIDSSTNSIEIAMFTFTHTILTEALIRAKKRGVNVKIAIDFQSKKGASSKVVEKLQKENIDILYNHDIKLCHHKYILLDNKTLVCGSANWTKSAFTKNYDCFLILYNLDETQKKFMHKLWKTIEIESSFLK